ncbi:hypothetical protein HW090_02690 [Pseudomonas sp. ABC1]|uniref:COG3650 family protein n=1 Tax=Pseudomonas sp. ABC1 TaxID=2748080 RepID=UPI0015C3C70D|nr:hypothetical protein [Pseudomonas sp. ABC1]QLF92169.1 hypothetical protein HW090_02690 [Pseudomonas sp. ABC1]
MRPLLFLLFPLLGACQSLFTTEPSAPALERLQGEVRRDAGNLLLSTCKGDQTLQVLDQGDSGFNDDAAALFADGASRLFVDLGGVKLGKASADGQPRLDVRKVYRLQNEGHGCDDPQLATLALRASGNEPFWTVSISPRGLLLERPDQPPLALPYLEEQLPQGQINFSSEANQQRLELWVAPQRCVDSASGAVSHLSAVLSIDGKRQNGCGYFGALRTP